MTMNVLDSEDPVSKTISAHMKDMITDHQKEWGKSSDFDDIEVYHLFEAIDLYLDEQYDD